MTSSDQLPAALMNRPSCFGTTFIPVCFAVLFSQRHFCFDISFQSVPHNEFEIQIWVLTLRLARAHYVSEFIQDVPPASLLWQLSA